MALVSPNSSHPELIRDPAQPMEDDDTSTPHACSFDPSSRAITTTSNPGSVIHSPMSCSHSAQFRVDKNPSRSNSRQRARNATNQIELLKQQIGLAFQHISSSINQSQDENLIALDALSEDARAQYTKLQLLQTRLAKGELIVDKELQDARNALATLEGVTHDEQERLKIAIAQEFSHQETQQKENAKSSEIRDKILEAKVISLKAQFAAQLKKTGHRMAKSPETPGRPCCRTIKSTKSQCSRTASKRPSSSKGASGQTKSEIPKRHTSFDRQNRSSRKA